MSSLAIFSVRSFHILSLTPFPPLPLPLLLLLLPLLFHELDEEEDEDDLLEDPNMEDDDEPCFDDILSKLFWVKTVSSLLILIDSSLTLSRRDSLSFWFLIFRVSSQLNLRDENFFYFFLMKTLVLVSGRNCFENLDTARKEWKVEVTVKKISFFLEDGKMMIKEIEFV